MDMRAVEIGGFGGDEVLQSVTREAPRPGPGEVCVRVAACALNHLDLRVRRGEFPMLDLPRIPGSDVAGTVEGTDEPVIVYPVLACGGCPACTHGNENLCREIRLLGVHVDGGYAERVVVPAQNAIPVPDTWEPAEWAATPLVFLTAWHALVTRVNLRVGETVLVHSAGSGLGSAAIQIASAGGSRVLTTVSSAVKKERAERLGAHEVIDTSQVDFGEAVLELTRGRGVDVVLDHIGGPTLEESVACLTRGGRLVACGETGHPSATLALRPLFNRERSVVGSYLGTRRELLDVLELLDNRTLRPVVDATIPLERADEAHRYLEERHAFGKVVLTI